MQDLTGEKFGMLTVQCTFKKDGEYYCKCTCLCGNETIARTSYIKSGHTKSCGCLKTKKRHGLSNTRLQRIYYRMKSRCLDEKDVHYSNYGGRGIRICDDWLNDISSFFEWALNNGYDDNLTIDRIDTNGNYEPSNCRWATRKEQSNNMRKNLNITFNGKTLTVAEWSDLTGIKYDTLRARLRYGWPVERALTEEVH